MPMVAIIGIRCGALRLRSGFSTSTSMTRPKRPDTTNANGSAAHSGNPKRATASTPAYAPTMKMAPCERLMTPSTPKISVKPGANNAYSAPSDRPLTSCWASTAR